MTRLLHFSTADWVVLFIYLGFLIYLGFRGVARKTDSAEEFILGGRRLTLPGFVVTLVSTWYGGILGVGEFSYLYGLSNWLVFGLPYYIFAIAFAWFFAERVRSSTAFSIPDKMRQIFDERTGLAASALVFFISSPAPYFLMQAVLLQVLTGWSFLLSLSVSAVFSVVYVFAGGFRSVVRTDYLHFALMFGGFIVALLFLIPTYGLFPFLSNHVPATHLTLTGIHTWQYIVVWFFIAVWTLVAPQFHQFTLSARTPQVAKRGIYISVLCWFIFDGITTLSGLYARALLPQLQTASMSYPILAEAVLPPIVKGLFYIGMVATVMSTVDGLTFISAVTVGRDILAKVLRNDDDAFLKKSTRIGILFTSAVAVAGVLLFPSVINLWYIIGTLFIPALLLPLVSAYYARIRLSARATFASMCAGFMVSFLGFIWGTIYSMNGAAHYPFGIEPMYDGIFVSVLFYFFGRKNGRPAL